MSRGFDDLVDTGGLAPDERQRLHRVHDLLVAAGPPPELTAALQHPPAQPAGRDADVRSFPLRRSRRGAGVLIAAAVAAACFGGGYALGDRLQSDGGLNDGGLKAVQVMQMQGVRENASASLRVGAAEQGGNSPLELTVSGLPKQAGKRDYYELFVWRKGKPAYPCGGFKMQNGTTTVRFTVPYRLTSSTKLVVTAIVPGKVRWPGDVVMTSA